MQELDSCYAEGFGLHYWNEIPIGFVLKSLRNLTKFRRWTFGCLCNCIKNYEHGQVIMLIINFEIFVLIVQKISAKLLPGANKSNTSPSVQDFYSTNTTSKQKPRTNPTLRLAKATLTLIPVMGMQNLIFILIPSQGEYNKTGFCQDLKKSVRCLCPSIRSLCLSTSD